MKYQLMKKTNQTLGALFNEFLKKEYDTDINELNIFLKSRKKIMIHPSIFIQDLGIMETIVKYLRENLKLSYCAISKKIMRDQRTVWCLYHKAKAKHPPILKSRYLLFPFPLSIIQNRQFSGLENIVHYYYERGLSPQTISSIISRSENTIRVTISRLKRKNGK